MTALVVAGFASAAPFTAAIGRLRDERRTIAGLWSPMPVAIPGADADGGRGIVMAVTATAVVMAALLYLLIWWTAVDGYAFDSGGRPANSWPAFLVAPVEFGALAAGVAGVIAFLVRAGLPRLHDPAFDQDRAHRDAGNHDQAAIDVPPERQV